MLLGVAALVVAVELAVAGRYGYHRDELYFLAAGHRPAWGYVDQPPLTPLLARLSELWGHSPVALRVLPALAAGACVVLAGTIARTFGTRGGWTALAGAATGFAPVTLGACHLMGPTAFDLLGWLAVLQLVILAVRDERPRLWLVAGAVLGVALLNKQTMAFYLLPPLLLALLVTPQRRLLASVWPYAGGLLAAVISSPNLAWQAANGWPLLTMGRSLHSEHTASQDYLTFWPAQILYSGPLMFPVLVAGLGWLLRSPSARPYRFLAWLAVFASVELFITAPGRPYYISGMYGLLFAAGARCLQERRSRRRAQPKAPIGRLLPALAVLSLLTILPLAQPVLPMSTWHDRSTKAFNYDLGETIGWPQLVQQVAVAARRLTPSERAHLAVFTDNYGEAGAVDRFGPALGLPAAHSGHNSYWLWGPPPNLDTTALLVGTDATSFPWCSSRTVVATVSNPVHVHNDEYGAPITVCHLTVPWSDIWPATRHYD
jgi:4-amino-4-deoxy-L-arabinose transferase-like glycosyltransferase